jgi:hypothetical protein
MSGTVDIVARLRVLLSKCCTAPAMAVWSRDLRDAADEIEQLRKERDEARQRLCKVVGDNRDMWGEDVAKEYGWDCFKEEK